MAPHVANWPVGIGGVVLILRPYVVKTKSIVVQMATSVIQHSRLALKALCQFPSPPQLNLHRKLKKSHVLMEKHAQMAVLAVNCLVENMVAVLFHRLCVVMIKNTAVLKATRAT